jgi:hypothetical protein
MIKLISTPEDRSRLDRLMLGAGGFALRSFENTFAPYWNYPMDWLISIALLESGFDPMARAAGSTAKGLFQGLDGTPAVASKDLVEHIPMVKYMNAKVRDTWPSGNVAFEQVYINHFVPAFAKRDVDLRGNFRFYQPHLVKDVPQAYDGQYTSFIRLGGDTNIPVFDKVNMLETLRRRVSSLGLDGAVISTSAMSMTIAAPKSTRVVPPDAQIVTKSDREWRSVYELLVISRVGSNGKKYTVYPTNIIRQIRDLPLGRGQDVLFTKEGGVASTTAILSKMRTTGRTELLHFMQDGFTVDTDSFLGTLLVDSGERADPELSSRSSAYDHVRALDNSMRYFETVNTNEYFLAMYKKLSSMIGSMEYKLVSQLGKAAVVSSIKDTKERKKYENVPVGFFFPPLPSDLIFIFKRLVSRTSKSLLRDKVFHSFRYTTDFIEFPTLLSHGGFLFPWSLLITPIKRVEKLKPGLLALDRQIDDVVRRLNLVIGTPAMTETFRKQPVDRYQEFLDSLKRQPKPPKPEDEAE